MNEVIEKRLTTEQLEAELSQCIGTYHWYRHNLNRHLIYSDGVKLLAEYGGRSGAYWFIDKIACEIFPLLKASVHDKKSTYCWRLIGYSIWRSLTQQRNQLFHHFF